MAYRLYTRTCQTLNEDWEYKLWTNQNITELPSDMNVLQQIKEEQGIIDYLKLVAL